jgi:hypothetical protein
MSLIKLATPGSGFARLQAIGLGEKTLQQYAGSSWLKNATSKTIAPIVKKEVPKVISKEVYDQALKTGKNGLIGTITPNHIRKYS